MKKFVWLIFAMTLVACGAQEAEPDYALLDLLEQKNAIIAELENRIDELVQTQQDNAAEQEAIIDDFLENVDWTAIADFLGIPDLYIARENIELHGDFVFASGYFLFEDDMHLIFYHDDWAGWRLLEYRVHWVVGRVDLPPYWAWEQVRLFDSPFAVRFYNYFDFDDYEVITREIEPEGWQRQVIEYMATYAHTHINHIWYEGSLLVADLKPAPAVFFNWGSTGGYLRTMMLINSLSSMPNVAEIQVLIGGQRGVAMDHFNFAQVFRVD
ncbi:MAG: hypothetical protein LBE35_11705 [Clostridiales bacterium]|jgi:hypothetical protein|nr:hypothetical protein [Clostridiales bacterium]